MQTNVLLLSIRPEYANKIFAERTKKVDLRRVRPRLNPGDLVLVYVSSPKKAVVGSFKVKKIIEEPISYLWEQVKDNAGITPEDFYTYYEGASVGVAIFLKDIQTFNQPVELDRLREKLSSWRPPQSYRYLTESELEIVKCLAQSQA